MGLRGFWVSWSLDFDFFGCCWSGRRFVLCFLGSLVFVFFGFFRVVRFFFCFVLDPFAGVKVFFGLGFSGLEVTVCKSDPGGPKQKVFYCLQI